MRRSCSTPVAWTALCCLPRVTPMMSAAFFSLVVAGLPSDVSGSICSSPSLHRPPMLALACCFRSVVLLIFFCVNIPQSLLIVVAERVVSFTTSTEGRSIAPRCRRHFLSFVTDLPPNVLSSAPPLEARRLPPVHLLISCIIYYEYGI